MGAIFLFTERPGCVGVETTAIHGKKMLCRRQIFSTCLLTKGSVCWGGLPVPAMIMV